MITLKDGSQWLLAEIKGDKVLLRGYKGNKYLSFKDYQKQWAKGVINPVKFNTKRV